MTLERITLPWILDANAADLEAIPDTMWHQWATQHFHVTRPERSAEIPNNVQFPKGGSKVAKTPKGNGKGVSQQAMDLLKHYNIKL